MNREATGQSTKEKNGQAGSGPRSITRRSEKVFTATLYLTALSIIVLLAAVCLTLIVWSLPSIRAFGFRFITGTVWDPVSQEYGALPFLVGTLLTSFTALLISIPFSVAISVFLGEYYERGVLPSFLKSCIEVLAGIPSIIYGMWGLFILMPIVRLMEIALGVSPYGVGIFTSAVILAIMIIPFSASIGREVINLVPADIKEAAYSLGATRYEVIKKIVIPYARSGIFAGILLALGRALGETMAVTMLIGNSNFLPKSLFSPANTMASIVANEFTEATETIYLSSLIQIGLLLFLVTTVVNVAGTYIIKRVSIAGQREVT
jgi:phosphate transport system permease protein